MFAALAVAACSRQAGDTGPHMELHTVKELLGDPKLFAQIDAQCARWKGPQQSPASFPAVVITTCNNLNGAKTFKAGQAERKQLLREAGS